MPILIFLLTVALSQAATLEQQRVELDVNRQAISKMLQQARTEHDIVRVTCLNDKLTQTNVNNAAFVQHLKQWKTDKAQYDILQILVQRGKALLQEANACVGQDTGYIGRTVRDTQIDDSIANPTEDAPGVDVSVDVRPPDASGSK